MKIFLLGDIYSTHFTKWIKALVEQNYEIHVFTFYKRDNLSAEYNCVNLYYGSTAELNHSITEGSPRKLLLYRYFPKLIHLIRKVKPDVLHAHYATSYGLLGALTFFHPFILSVWGSDILTFPERSYLHKKLIKFILNKADLILCTSRLLVDAVSKYKSQGVSQLPFGIDPEKFRNTGFIRSDNREIIIGTIKSLKKTYGIDILIKIFKRLKENNPDKSLKLLLGGVGPEEESLRKLCKDLQLEGYVEFTGNIPYDIVETIHNRISIFANLSLSESFGVAVLEASACEVPVVASDIGGLPEVVIDGITGFLVNLNNMDEITEAFQKLIDDDNLRLRMGQNGRNLVLEKYTWKKNIEEMINIYEEYT
jgi:L-malate glycosyltransferase